MYYSVSCDWMRCEISNDRLMNKFAQHMNRYIAALLFLILAALLAWLSVRYSWETDLTRGGRHQLSQASRQVLARMHGAIKVTSYARNEPELRVLVRDFIYRYQRVKHDIDLKFVNPDTVPEETRNLGISVDGELVIRYKGRLEHVRTDSEQAFTNALQRLLRGTTTWVAFTEGHGERDPLRNAGQDISIWARQMKNRGLNLQPINLASLNSIPDNTAVLVIASPRTGFLPGEVHKIIDYLNAGGNLLWLVDPGERDGLGALRKYLGLKFPAGTIIDIAGQVIGIKDPRITLATRSLYGKNPAVAKFEMTTLFPGAVPIDTSPTGSWKVTPVITTATHTWLERGNLNGKISYDKDQDRLGPFNLAVSLERVLHHAKSDRQQRILVVGDGDFVSNTYINKGGNLELGIRLIDWLTRGDNFINIPVRTVEDADLQFSKSAAIIIGFGLLVLLPAGLLATGGFIWWRRKHR